jgi:hypothetical protein
MKNIKLGLIAIAAIAIGFVLLALQIGFFGTIFGVLSLGAGIILLIVANPSTKKAPKGKFVRSKSSDTFHKPSCRVAKMIDQRNLQVYADTTAQYLRSIGLKPCNKCKPR